MGRTSKLNDRQWAEIGRRLANNESARSLAKEFGVSPSTISERFSERLPNIKKLATTLASVEKEVEQLPESERVSVRTLADHMKAISNNLASAAAHGSRTARILAGKASMLAEGMGNAMGEDGRDRENMKVIHALSTTGNEASKIALSLVAANKAQVEAPGNVTIVTGVPDAE